MQAALVGPDLKPSHTCLLFSDVQVQEPFEDDHKGSYRDLYQIKPNSENTRWQKML